MSLATDHLDTATAKASVRHDSPAVSHHPKSKAGRMAGHDKPLLIKRYASRRLYNTETSDYVTLEDIARVIQAGRDVVIVDLKTGDDMTRQYLLQIIAEHESKGENVLPLGILNDLIRSYTGPMEAMLPQFLAASFAMLQADPAQAQSLGTTPFASARGGQGRSDISTADLADIRTQLAELQDKLSRL